jgi:hypothetical protein
MEISAWNSMKRARNLLTVAGCFAANGVDEDDSCRDLAEKFATLIDLIEDEVDDAMTFIPDELKATRAEAKPADDGPDGPAT